MGVLRQEAVPWDGKGTPLEHAMCKPRGVHAGVMEIFQHGPRLPAAHHAGMEWVDVGSDEGHGSTTSEGPDTNVLGLEA